MAHGAKNRQRIIDGYLADSGQNLFVPGQFVDWLADRPDHEAYAWFYGQGDAEAAREHRIALARRMASGLRITARFEEQKSSVVSVVVRQYPAFVSPVANRRQGGGYGAFDPHDSEAVAELRRQGAVSAATWLRRYAGVYAHLDLSVFEEIAASESRVALPV